VRSLLSASLACSRGNGCVVVRTLALRKFLRLLIATPRESKHPSTLMHGYLRDNMRGGSEPVDTETLCVASADQRAVADEARAE